jgi:Zn-dependent peptidase ImmA (M78 family)
MSDKLKIREAENEAKTLIQRLDIKALPICPFKIAQDHGIVVEPKGTNSGISGCLIRIGDIFGIQYADHIDSQGFKNFTVAHELGHYFIPGHHEALIKGINGVHQSKSGFVSDDIYEKQADNFAKELLMPEHLFRQTMDQTEVGLNGIEALANICNTSLTATAIRYCLFAEDPVAIIMSEGDTVNWCFMSEPLLSIQMQWIEKGSIIPHGTHTANYNRHPENILNNVRDEKYSNLNQWFESAPDIEMEEDIIGLGAYGKTLTVLYTTDAIELDDYF